MAQVQVQRAGHVPDNTAARMAPDQSNRLDVPTAPVNQNGSFEIDRVLKSGSLLRRTRKTKVCLLSYTLPPC
jgi:hypothetical protein